MKGIPGGVARNISEALSLLGHNPMFISAVGDDVFGKQILQKFLAHNSQTDGILVSKNNPTALYSALLTNKKECLFGLGEMNIHSEINQSHLLQMESEISSAPIIILDANIPINSINYILHIANNTNIPIFFEPTEVRKARKICQIKDFKSNLHAVKFLSPNARELINILAEANLLNDKDSENLINKIDNSSNVDNLIKDLASKTFSLFSNLDLILLTRGKSGFLMITKDQSGVVDIKQCDPPSIKPEDIESVSGAGDCLAAGFISGILNNSKMENCVQKATLCADKSLRSIFNVPNELKFIK